ncbi:PREDICTED: glycerophosphodiester phosphodiesterase GDPDL3-like [Nelumbo nucifera]|uniref:glycerophosphodiester phosphodiesterase n=2 Tax=Nelumbo nucifera TaxID=4432 RepID=A0A822XWT5_NELNU|nr:PREDICTED: glycerophosphodiester phosphodiesterase GDPDL3-like [Nelumbo nucifera]DAD23579.1 TPA_asm: hypothetical protein HUJ06_025042 [Nelumbo nucifera]
MPVSRSLFLLFLLHLAVLVVARRSIASSEKITSPWQTLSGNAPLVIAKGGFSGIFPDSSYHAYALALITSLPNVVLWCDVQLTKDGDGICFPYLNLGNSSSISYVFNDTKMYRVNGQLMEGFFSVDFTLDDLTNVYLTQGIYSRANKFDGNMFKILTVEDVAKQLKPPGLWLNIQHDAFFTQHNLSMRSFVLSVSRRVIVSYISSPEVAFLRSITARFKQSTTKLVFRFLRADDIEPTTNQTYDSILKNLTFVKTFASAILVPKNYIWPVNTDLYLQPHTSVVLNAHREGLEVFASDFANDVPLSYNYSYDPIKECLSFIDNGKFSVDGILSDFPITPSEAIDCFAHLSTNSSGKAPLVISHNGASGIYPSSTDIAYKQAFDDGADVIDCAVQMTQDGVSICLGSINLMDGTNVVQTDFNSRSTTIRQIQPIPGIFTFNLTWEEIKTLKPVISNPSRDFALYRNPAYKYAGSIFSLKDFLAFAKDKPLSVLISIENAAYLAESLGLSVTNAVIDALNQSGYNNQTNQKVMIQSSNRSVLIKFKEKTNYQLVYKIDEDIRDADDSSIKDIKQFAHSVAITKESVFPTNQLFLTGATNIVSKLQSSNLTVYVYLFRNEFVSQAWDFFSDPVVEINSFVMGAGIDGIITDFPGTATAYRNNKCLKMGKNKPYYMNPVEPGALMQVITAEFLPPAESPNPVLTESDVAEPPLASITKNITTTGNGTVASPETSPKSSGHLQSTACVFLSSLGMLLLLL